MSYYSRTCPHCGAHLDPGERCDCRDEEAAADTANTDGGGVEHGTRPVPSYHTTNDREDAR